MTGCGEIRIRDTESFRKAVKIGSPTALFIAGCWLHYVSVNPHEYSQYDNRWMDHRDRELFQAYCRLKNWSGAKRVVECSIFEKSREGRVSRLEELSGIKYAEIEL